MKINPAVPCGFVLDLLLADPAWMPHPVVYMGKAITALEDLLRPRLPKTPKGELLGGTILAAALPAGTFAVASGACALAYKLHPKLGFALETVWCWQALALKGLAQESAAVQRELEKGGLPAARKAVGRIVGRDTGNLTTEGVTKAAVETVAENTSDGVVAPLVFLALGGAPLGFFYKAANTMDSMLGYTDPPYRDIGLVPARMDDVLNYLPARLSALLMLAAGGLLRMDFRGGWKIFRRDRYNHASPNSAQTESVCAGLLGLRLAGDAWYHGTLHKKPYIGDPVREVEAEDIPRACSLLYGTAVLALALVVCCKILVLVCR